MISTTTLPGTTLILHISRSLKNHYLPEKQAKAKPVPAAKTSSPKASSAQKKSTADILAAARSGGSKPAGKLSTADILAKARGAKTTPPPSAADPEPDEPPLPEETLAANETPEQNESPQIEKSSSGELPTTTAEKVAWCRQHDAQ